MASHRFHYPGPLSPDTLLTLPDSVARHAVTVLRLEHGDAVTLFNGDGREYDGIMERHGKKSCVRLRASHEADRESPLDTTLVQGISSGERMDYTLQKSVELGVSRIQPVMMRRTVVRLDSEKRGKRLLHWQGVVVSACEQCGRNRIPEVKPILDFADWLRSAAATDGLGLLLDPGAEAHLRDLPSPTMPLQLLAGPEGGLDPAERDAALRIGFRRLSLGPRILRTETAALAALAALQTRWGDL